LATTLRELRLRAGLSQRQLASRMSVPRTWVSKFELERCVPTVPNLARIAGALGLSVCELFVQCERRRGESHAGLLDELLSDPFVAALAIYVPSLTGPQRRTVLAELSVMVHSRRRAA